MAALLLPLIASATLLSAAAAPSAALGPALGPGARRAEGAGEGAVPPIFNKPPANDAVEEAPAPEETAGGVEAVGSPDPEAADSDAAPAGDGEAPGGPAGVVRPCISLSTCRFASQSLGLDFATVGDGGQLNGPFAFTSKKNATETDGEDAGGDGAEGTAGDAASQTKGCYEEAGVVYWNDGEVYETAAADLPPGRGRVHCTDGPTVVGSVVWLGPCPDAASCEAAAGTSYAFAAVDAAPSRGCFRKNGVVYWSPGTDDEMTAADLPGVRVRVYCPVTLTGNATGDAAGTDAGDGEQLNGPFAFTSKKNATETDGEGAGGDGAEGTAGDAAVAGESGAVPTGGAMMGLLVIVLAAAAAV